MHIYDFWGLYIASDYLWPALASFSVADGHAQPDVHIHTRVSTRTRTAPQIIIHPYVARWQIAEVGCYEVHAGRAIVVTPEPQAMPNAVQLYLLGSVWGTLCYQRGLLPIHASVVRVEHGAVAFCGPSGAGKSTLVAWLTRSGYPLLGDDLCRFDPIAEQPPHVWPGLPRLKLWRATLDALGQSTATLEQDLAREDKFHVPCAITAEATPQPLRAIYLLEWGPLHLTPLTGIAALRQFVAAATYRGELLEPMGRLAAHWQACAEVVHRAPVYRLSRPKDWASIQQVLSLIDHMQP